MRSRRREEVELYLKMGLDSIPRSSFSPFFLQDGGKKYVSWYNDQLTNPLGGASSLSYIEKRGTPKEGIGADRSYGSRVDRLRTGRRPHMGDRALIKGIRR